MPSKGMLNVAILSHTHPKTCSGHEPMFSLSGSCRLKQSNPLMHRSIYANRPLLRADSSIRPGFGEKRAAVHDWSTIKKQRASSLRCLT